ncbi:MAG: UDP-2,3-diacylglucosamine diphosphatase LpxI [Deltaproteobacteria bacterium]|nr:UDP-2,3-diacylglucosamine diphosphatase LpxI [Deltaproteobacteria bacterium]
MTEGDRLGEDVFGILAGRGEYPIILSERLVSAGKRVVIAGTRGQYSGWAPEGCGAVAMMPLGAIGAVARFFGDNGASRAFMAGGVRRRGAWRSARPDLHGLALIPRALLGGDDGLLTALAEELARLGVEVCDPSSFLGGLFAGEGLLAGPELDPEDRGAVELAWRAARDLGRTGRGQAVVVHRGVVVGREGRAGTDALLARAPGPGAVLAKAVKPGQDRRFDMPAIGPSTIIVASLVGVRAIAVETGGVLLLRKERVLELCEERGVSLVGL